MYISMNSEFIIKELYQLIKIDVFSNQIGFLTLRSMIPLT